MTGLTWTQARILSFIARYTAREGVPPSIRDICEQFSVSSTNGVAEHIKALRRKGALRAAQPGRARSFVLTDFGKQLNEA